MSKKSPNFGGIHEISKFVLRKNYIPYLILMEFSFDFHTQSMLKFKPSQTKIKKF